MIADTPGATSGGKRVVDSIESKPTPTRSELTSSPSVNEGDSPMAINALIAKHWMLRYPTHSGSGNRRAVARTGNRCAAFKPCQCVIALTLANQEHRRNTVVIQHKERRFLPGLKARVSAPNIR